MQAKLFCCIRKYTDLLEIVELQLINARFIVSTIPGIFIISTCTAKKTISHSTVFEREICRRMLI